MPATEGSLLREKIRDKRGAAWRVIKSSYDIRIALYLCAFLIQVILYTIIFHHFYPFFEGKTIPWDRSLLFVMETITTTGYGEILPFHSSEMTYLSITIMVTGIVMIFMMIPVLLLPYFSSLVHPTPPRSPPHELNHHVIIFGYNELTRFLLESLMISDHEILLIESDETRAMECAVKYRRRAYVIWGNYTDQATWKSAWVANSRDVIISLDERTAANIILGIRGMTDARIIVVVDKLSLERYLRYAGAEYVLSPKNLTGRMLARYAALVSDLGDLEENDAVDRLIEETWQNKGNLVIIPVPIVPGSHALGKKVSGLDLMGKYGFGCILLIKGGEIVSPFSGEEIIDTSMLLFLIGPADNVAHLVENEFTAKGARDHRAVIAGFGDVGRSAFDELSRLGVKGMVIDQKSHDVPEVIGNAENEQVLKAAGIEDAQFAIIALNDDDVNIFSTLMAWGMNPSMRILARANEPASVDKLYRAGADYVALLPAIGGQVIGKIVLSDEARILFDLPNGEMIILRRFMRKSVASVGWLNRKTGARILGIDQNGEGFVFPAPDTLCTTGCLLYVMGSRESLKKVLSL